jgi:putative salt-induced outer membrane protein YdiY
MNRTQLIVAGTVALGAAGLQAQDATLATNAPPKWESSAAAGFTLTQGNSDSVLFTAQVLTQKKWDIHEVRLGADVTYGETDDVKSADAAHAFGQYNRLFTERFYGYGRIDALHDAVADIEYRFLLSPGVGYYLIKNATTTLSVEGGPGFIFEKQGGEETGYVTARLAERLEHKFNENVRLWQSVEFLPQVDDLDNFLINAEIGVEAKLTERFSMKVFAVDNYDNEPAEGRESNDIKVVTALAYTF